MSRATPPKKVSYQMLQKMAGDKRNAAFEMASPKLAQKDTAILGRFIEVECLNGMTVHATDTVEAHDMVLQWSAAPCLKIAIMLEGSLKVWLNHTPIELGDTPKQIGQIWSVSEQTVVSRTSTQDMHVRKVIISMSLDSILKLFSTQSSSTKPLRSFINKKISSQPWSPSNRAISLAEQIVNSADNDDPLHKLDIESKALQIVYEALSTLVQRPTAQRQKNKTTKGQVRANQIRSYLQAHFTEPFTLEGIAASLGMSISSMQADFKKAYGTTVADFNRLLRLEYGKRLIERDGKSISEAAYEVGYTSPASFSTAYKKVFGFPPSQIKD